MNYEDIVALAKAGFTASQIAAMNKPANAPANQPANAPDNQPANAPANQPANATANQPANAPANNGIDAVLAQIKALTEAVQANGIINSNQPPQRTADDILAEILNPKTNK